MGGQGWAIDYHTALLQKTRRPKQTPLPLSPQFFFYLKQFKSSLQLPHLPHDYRVYAYKHTDMHFSRNRTFFIILVDAVRWWVKGGGGGGDPTQQTHPYKLASIQSGSKPASSLTLFQLLIQPHWGHHTSPIIVNDFLCHVCALKCKWTALMKYLLLSYYRLRIEYNKLKCENSKYKGAFPPEIIL